MSTNETIFRDSSWRDRVRAIGEQYRESKTTIELFSSSLGYKRYHTSQLLLVFKHLDSDFLSCARNLSHAIELCRRRSQQQLLSLEEDLLSVPEDSTSFHREL